MLMSCMLATSVFEPLSRFPMYSHSHSQVNHFKFTAHWQSILVYGWTHFLGCKGTYWCDCGEFIRKL